MGQEIHRASGVGQEAAVGMTGSDPDAGPESELQQPPPLPPLCMQI